MSAGAYVAVARLGLMLASLHGNVSPVWPATGFSIWLLIAFGRGMWPAVVVGAFVANALTDIPLGVAAAIAAGNTLEAVAGAWLWHWGQARWKSVLELRELTGVFFAALFGPVASASVGVVSLLVAGAVPLSAAGKLWGTWWTGDALGALTVLPALLAGPEIGRMLHTATAREGGKWVLLLAVITGVSWLAFMMPDGGAFLFAIFPVLLLAMTWFGAPGAKWAALLIAAAGIAAAYYGHGPFTTGEANQDLLNLQVFLAAVTVTALVLPVFGRGKNSRLPVAVLLVGWMLSGWVFATAQREGLRNQRELLGERIAAAEKSIQARMATYEETLRGGVSLMTASKSLVRSEWRTFAETLQLEKRFPGIDGLGVVFRVKASATDAFLRRMRAEGAPDFAVHTVQGSVAPAAGERYVIAYLEPEAFNRPALGLDVASEPNRLWAADQARDTGQPCMTGRIVLVQDELRRPGFLLLLPFYRPGAATHTIAERQEALEGWIDALFITENFMHSVLGAQEEILQVHFFEAGGMDREHLWYASAHGSREIPPRFDRVTEMQLAGRHFQLGWRRGPHYPGGGTSPLVWVAASFALATLLLAGLVTSLQTFRQRAERLATERTAELERAQRLLAAVNQIQTSVLNGTTYSIISTTPDGVIETFNTGAEAMLGYSADELVGRLKPTVLHDEAELAEHAATLSAKLQREIAPGFEVLVARTRLGEADEREWTYVRKDGSRLPVRLSVTALRNAGGDISGFLGIAQDLTAHKQSEQAREHAHSLTRAAFESTADGILVVNREGKIDTYNQQFSEMWRVPEGVLESRDDARAIDCVLEQLSDPAQFFNKVKELYGQPEAENMDTLLFKDGRVVERYSRPQRMQDKIVGRVWSFRDITQRHQTEVRLRASEQRLQSVLGQADCIVWEAQVKLTETDWEWQFVYQPSRLFERLCGERLPAQGFAVWDRFEIPERAEMGQRCRDAFRTDQPGYTQEFHLIDKHQTAWIREAVSITKLKPGEFWLVGVMTDITERKRAELQMQLDEERMRLATEAAGVAVWEWDVVTGKITWDAGMFAIYGIEPTPTKEIPYQVWAGAVHSDDLPAQEAQLRSLVASGGHGRREFRIINPVDQAIRFIQAAEMVIKDARGCAARVVGINIDITERKQAAAALGESEERFRQAFEFAGIGMAIIGLDGRWVRVNKAICDIVGYTAAELMRKTFQEITHPDDLESDLQHVRELLQGVRRVYQMEKRYIHRDGRLVGIKLTASLVRDATGVPLYFVSQIEDITARKAGADALRASEERFRTFSRVAPVGIYQTDPAGRCVYVNQRWTQIAGLSEAEAMGEGWSAALQTEDRAPVYAAWTAFVSEGKEFAIEYRFAHRGGDTVWVAGSAVALRDAQGQLIGYLGTVTDITAAKAAEQAMYRALTELEQQKFALDQHALVAVTDVQGRIIHANDKFCAVSQYSREELLGQTHRMINSGHHSAEFFREMYRKIASGQVWQAEICNQAKDGSLYWVDTTIVPFLGPNKKPTHYIAIRTDITERKQLGVSLAQARDQALEGSRLKSEFLATMSHEIRTPMNAVIGMAGLLYDTRLDAAQQEMTRTILGGAENLLAIINDILDFSRIEAGKMRIDRSEFDFNRVVEETVTLLATRAHEKQLELTCEIVPWSGALLAGDSGRVRQILTNLIGNAIKFTDRGEVAVSVRATGETEQRARLRVTIRDTGVGISREAQSRLFQPFVQADGSSTRRFGGTGLGLAITRQLIELMGGEIGFASEEGTGSVFWFELAFDRSGAAPVETSWVLPEGRRILVVDDNETNRRIVLAQLNQLGVEAEAVASGQEALGRLHDPLAGRWDLVLLDWHMPGLNGVDLAKLIRCDPLLAKLPLVMLSSSGLSVTAAELDPEFSAFLTKPVSKPQLKQCLTRVLRPPADRALATVRTKKVKPRLGLRLLLVEDNLANQRVATLLLERMGCEVDLAANGLIGLERLASKDYDAVLMDCQMPVMDGYEATRRIRTNTQPGSNPRVPIIAMTAYARPEDRARCLQAGMDDYVSKPIRGSALESALERCGLAAAAPAAMEASAAARDEAVFDLEALETTRSLPGMAGPSLLPEMVKLYLSDEAERLERLARLARERQAEGLAQEAHSFGGNAASFGGTQVRRVALDLESAARAQNWPAVTERMIELHQACARLKDEIAQLNLLRP